MAENEISKVDMYGSIHIIKDALARNMLSEEYNPQHAYMAGDLTVYEGYLYKCTADTTGEWESSKWTPTTVDAEMGESGAKGLYVRNPIIENDEGFTSTEKFIIDAEIGITAVAVSNSAILKNELGTSDNAKGTLCIIKESITRNYAMFTYIEAYECWISSYNPTTGWSGWKEIVMSNHVNMNILKRLKNDTDQETTNFNSGNSSLIFFDFSVTEGENLNDKKYTRFGFYSGNNLRNAPKTGWCQLFVFPLNGNPNYPIQIAYMTAPESSGNPTGIQAYKRMGAYRDSAGTLVWTNWQSFAGVDLIGFKRGFIEYVDQYPLIVRGSRDDDLKEYYQFVCKPNGFNFGKSVNGTWTNIWDGVTTDNLPVKEFRSGTIPYSDFEEADNVAKSMWVSFGYNVKFKSVPKVMVMQAGNMPTVVFSVGNISTTGFTLYYTKAIDIGGTVAVYGGATYIAIA